MLEPKVKFDRLQKLSPVLEEYTDWFARIVRCLQYPETYQEYLDSQHEPTLFPSWIEENEGDSFINELTIRDMKRLYGQLHAISADLVSRVGQTGERTSLTQFDRFIEVYDAFILRLHELEQACFEIDSGVDKVSGLRNEEAMIKEVTIELERRARRGNPFCLVIGRIDNYEHIRAHVNGDNFDYIITSVAKQVFKCLRTFDDAYRLQNGDFILSLKHTGTAGGTAAINRLRSMVEDADIRVEDEKGKFEVTMSYCLAEPQPGDTVQDLLEYMREDLKTYGDESEAAVEYIDKSPLARYIEKDS